MKIDMMREIMGIKAEVDIEVAEVVEVDIEGAEAEAT
jgi:hypothetical protein